MPQTISIQGKRSSATVFCSNLILAERTLCFLTAYGPTQEIRAFAQMLMSDESAMTVKETPLRRFTTHPIQLLKLDQGTSAITITPPLSSRLIVGETKDECFETFSRILDQQHFVLRDWYPALFDLSQQIEPLIGSKACFQTVKDVAHDVTQLIRFGRCHFPEPTAHFTLSQEDAHEALSH